MGDLVATCTSPLSRNRTFGYHLAQGNTVEEAAEATKGQVAEGVVSSQSVSELAAKVGVEMPITDAIVEICHRGANAQDEIQNLLGRSKKSEL